MTEAVEFTSPETGCVPTRQSAEVSPMLERMARSMLEAVARQDCVYVGGEAGDGATSEVIDGAVDFIAVAVAALQAIREPDEGFMLALYPDPDIDTADKGAGAGRRSRRAGVQQIAHFIDAILSEGAGE